MCGIAGFCNFKEDFEENTDYWNFRLEKMRAVLAHRGNDARGRYLKSILVCHTAVWPSVISCAATSQ